MNTFEKNFFVKYIPEWQEIQGVIHQHFIKIVGHLSLWIWLGVLLPSFLYYYSINIQSLLPYIFIEIYLYILFIKIIYDIFDWYNDVWIITDDGIINLDWALFSTDMTTLKYENIEWIEVQQDGIIDTILNKWDLIVHKIWDDEFNLKDAILPYKSVDLIEEISNKEDPNEKEDKFEKIMETLWWVVEDYLERKDITQEIKKDNENIEIIKVQHRDGTIDLR